MRILGISGSLRTDSHNTRLLRHAAQLLPEDAEFVLLDPDVLRSIPAYDDDLREAEGEPPSVAALRETIHQADGVLFATPEYNSSVPGFLKNALDWVSRPIAESPFKGKDAAVVGASTGMFGAVWAQAELRKVLMALGARVVDRELPVMNAGDVWADDGSFADGEMTEQLREHVAALVAAIEESASFALPRAA